MHLVLVYHCCITCSLQLDDIKLMDSELPDAKKGDETVIWRLPRHPSLLEKMTLVVHNVLPVMSNWPPDKLFAFFKHNFFKADSTADLKQAHRFMKFFCLVFPSDLLMLAYVVNLVP